MLHNQPSGTKTRLRPHIKFYKNIRRMHKEIARSQSNIRLSVASSLLRKAEYSIGIGRLPFTDILRSYEILCVTTFTCDNLYSTRRFLYPMKNISCII